MTNKLTIGHIKQILIFLKNSYPSSAPPTESMAKTWFMFFREANPEKLLEATQRHIASSKYYPAISELNERLNYNPDNENGVQKIMQAITKFGNIGEIQAREFLGEHLWKAVQRYGWKNLCETETKNLPIVTAQLKTIVDNEVKKISEQQSYERIPSKHRVFLNDLTKQIIEKK